MEKICKLWFENENFSRKIPLSRHENEEKIHIIDCYSNGMCSRNPQTDKKYLQFPSKVSERNLCSHWKRFSLLFAPKGKLSRCLALVENWFLVSCRTFNIEIWESFIQNKLSPLIIANLRKTLNEKLCFMKKRNFSVLNC